MGMNFWSKLWESIHGDDLYIGVFGIVALGFWILSIIAAYGIKRRANGWRAKKNVSFSKYLNAGLNFSYTLFTTIISLFPLLGMFGTVTALLGLDLSAGDMASIKDNFFNALTSTAWGIIFSVIYKLIHAFTVNFFEDQLEASKKVSTDEDAELVRSGATVAGRR